jgi:hypothetical protein
MVLLLAFFIWLSLGIKIDTLNVDKYRVDGLYIKLNKKLTLTADKVIIPKRKSNPSFNRVDEMFERVKYILTFFNHIELKEIEFDNNVLEVYFHDNILQLSTNDYLIRGNVLRKGNKLIGNIPILQIKQQNIIMRGEFSYNFNDYSLTTQGKFLFHDAAGTFWATKNDSEIDFRVHSDTLTDIKPIIDTFDLIPAVRSWVIDKVKAEQYKLLSLTGKGNIVNKEFKLDLDALKGKVLFTAVAIHFKEGLAPILAPSFVLSYSDKGGLFFDLEDPRYRGKNLDGSSVSIVNLREDNTTLKLNLKFDTMFNNYVTEILNAYNISVPVNQKSGKVNASLDMDIGLKQEGIKVKSDVALTKGSIEIDKVMLSVERGDLHYKNGVISLENIVLNDPAYEGVLNGTIDIQRDIAELVLEAEKIVLQTGEETPFRLKNERIPFTLDFSDGVMIDIPKYSVLFEYKQKVSSLKISDLNRIKKFLDDSIEIEEGGNIHIETKDYKTFTFNGVLKRSSCFLYEKNNECKIRIPFRGKASEKSLDFYALNDRLHYNKQKSRLYIENLNIDLKKFLTRQDEKKQSKKSKSFVIIGKNSNLRYDEYSLNTDSYDVEIKANGNIKALGSAGGDIVKFNKIDDNMTLQALRIKDKVLHPLINFDGLQKGRYSIMQTGIPEKMMKGEIIVEGGVMKDFKAYNNTLAFINTIPKLATLQKPAYSTEGFTITSGVVEYRMIKKKKVVFDSIYIKGDAATIIGKGEIDLEKKSINIELGIQVARTLGKAVGSIPLVGHILVGEHKSMTTGLLISGTLAKPEVSISAAQDILSYPLQLIKRTIEAPQKLLSPGETK